MVSKSYAKTEKAQLLVQPELKLLVLWGSGPKAYCKVEDQSS